jgi:UDP-N-acetylmuramoyl-tripeptide--D-alanyl-D-alanine ligase
MKRQLQNLLASISAKVLNKYQPLVIGITGSVGKTSAKEAVYAAISGTYKTKKNIKNYNNEFGVPLTILESEAPGKNIFNWSALLYKAKHILYDGIEYPKVLVLELGVDHPGDMDYLADLVKPKIAIITAIGQSHIEFFGSEQSILDEKKKILRYLGSSGTAIINYDNHMLRGLIPKVHSKIITYGVDPGAEVRAELINTSFEKGEHGTSFVLVYAHHRHPVFLRGVLGNGHVLAYLAGISAALALGISMEDAANNLSKYNAQPGRMRILSGADDSIIIDDTYNSSPQAVKMALKELKQFPEKKKILILGDMLELGSYSHKEHIDLAEEISEVQPIKIVLIGKEMSGLAVQIMKMGYPKEHLLYFKNISEAVSDVKKIIEPKVLYFVKGSQGMRMEYMVKELIIDKGSAEDLLVRQNREWLKRT